MHSLLESCFILLLLMCGLLLNSSVAAALDYPSIRKTILTEQTVNPAKYRITNEVVVFDLWKYFDQAGIKDTNERADVVYLVTSLQGIVNRTKPRLYIIAALALFDVETRFYYDPKYQEKPVTNLDEFWLKELKQKGYFTKVRHIDDLEALIRYYRKDLSGLVLWSMDVPATANAALMAAGCENLLPVSRDLGGGRLRRWLSEHFPDLTVKLGMAGRFNGQDPIKMDDGRVIPSTGSAKNDVYRFAIERYLKSGICNPYYLWYDCDAAMWGAQRNPYAGAIYGYLGDKNELQQNGMYNIDFWVAKRAFVFDLLPWGDTTPNDDPKQAMGTDLATWNDILETSYKRRGGEFGELGGFVPWWMKYTDVVGDKHEGVPTEWEFIALATSYNLVNEGDAAFGIANASFFTHLPQMTQSELKTPPPPKIPYKNDTTYVAFCMMDYDGSAWVNAMVPTVYDDPNRGKLPLNWCINPILHRRIPHAMRYLYEHRTPLDYFGFSCDGVGYIDPLALSERRGRVKESGIAAYEQFASTIYKRYAVDYNVFYISPHFVSPWIDMASRLDKGFGYNVPMPQQLVNGTPMTYVQTIHVSQMSVLEANLRQVFENSSKSNGYSSTFKAYRCILVTPSMITNIVEKLRKEFPDAKVEITDLRNFYSLLSQKLSHPLVSPYRDSKELSAQPNTSNGVMPIQSAGGNYEIKTIQDEPAWVSSQQQYGLYLCFEVDDAFSQNDAQQPLELEVSYLDQGTGTIELQYDSLDPSAPLDGAYKSAKPIIELENSGKWCVAKFQLDDPRFSNRENDGTDLRFCKVQNDQLIIRSVTLRKIDSKIGD
ncbi:hypothetical protein LLG39_08255 [bacterium]|nr:hypothetical protein [bacterium]